MNCTRRAMSLVEVLVMVALAAVLIGAACSLSSRNTADHADAAERLLAQGVALDALERLKRFKASWTLPGTASPGDPDGATPADELYGALETRPEHATAIDRALAAELKTLGMTALPRVERVEDAEYPGLFRLEVTVTWKPRRGSERHVKFTRYCYAP